MIITDQTQLKNSILKLIPSNHPSHNRLVCIVDRRKKFYDLKILGKKDRNAFLSCEYVDDEIECDQEIDLVNSSKNGVVIDLKFGPIICWNVEII